MPADLPLSALPGSPFFFSPPSFFLCLWIISQRNKTHNGWLVWRFYFHQLQVTHFVPRHFALNAVMVRLTPAAKSHHLMSLVLLSCFGFKLIKFLSVSSPQGAFKSILIIQTNGLHFWRKMQPFLFDYFLLNLQDKHPFCCTNASWTSAIFNQCAENHFYQICASALPFVEHVKQQIKFAWWHQISSFIHGALCDIFILFFNVFRYVWQWHPTMWMNNPRERRPIKRVMHPLFVSIAIGLFAPPLSCAQQHKPVNDVASRVWAAITDNPGAPHSKTTIMCFQLPDTVIDCGRGLTNWQLRTVSFQRAVENMPFGAKAKSHIGFSATLNWPTLHLAL